MATREKELGHIRISELNSEITTKKGVPGIWIPFPDNKCIFIHEGKNGKTNVDVEIEVIPTPNSKYTDKMVKASLPKAVREKERIQFDSDEYRQMTPILGNLKYFQFEDRSQQTQARNTQADDDLPPDLNPEADWGDEPDWGTPPARR